MDEHKLDIVKGIINNRINDGLKKRIMNLYLLNLYTGVGSKKLNEIFEDDHHKNTLARVMVDFKLNDISIGVINELVITTMNDVNDHLFNNDKERSLYAIINSKNTNYKALLAMLTILYKK